MASRKKQNAPAATGAAETTELKQARKEDGTCNNPSPKCDKPAEWHGRCAKHYHEVAQGV